jgi:hypothetical protein
MNENPTDYEITEVIWDTMYPDRRKFFDLEQTTRDEWIELMNVTRKVLFSAEKYKKLKKQEA